MFSKQNISQFFPILEWLPAYKTSYLRPDLVSGLTIGIMLIPQGMAYALIAGLPPVFGLYAALIPQIIYAFTGTSRQLTVGPVAMDSLLVAAGLTALSITGVENYIAMAILLALIMGVIQLLLGLLKMGFLVNYLSKPVISGFTSAAAIIIGLSQLKHLLGISMVRSNKIHILLADAFQKISSINLYTLAIGLIGIIILIALKRLAPKIPRALIVVVFGIISVLLFKLEKFGVSVVEDVPSGLPLFQLPSVTLSNLQDLFPIAATLALIAFMEAISVSKSLEERHDDYEVDANQELIALGLSNIGGSFFQSYPTTGGFSRTAVNEQSGAKTLLSSIVAAIVVGLTLLFFTSWFYYLPHAILASIIMVAVTGLIDFKLPKTLFKNQKGEFVLLLLTFLVTLSFGIKEGIIIGVLSSLVFTIYRLSKPHVAELGQIKGTDYYRNINRFEKDIETISETKIIRFDSPLFFGNKDFFKKTMLKHLKESPTELRHLVLVAESMNYIDSSGLATLHQIKDELKSRGIIFYISNAIGPVRDALYKSKLITDLDNHLLFVDVKDAIAYIKEEETESALERRIARQTIVNTK